MIETAYQRFLQVTGDAGAAATLVLAEVLAGKADKGPETDWLGVKDAAQRLKVSETTIYKLCDEGRLRHKRVGRQIRIAPTDLVKVVEKSSRKDADAMLEQFLKA